MQGGIVNKRIGTVLAVTILALTLTQAAVIAQVGKNNSGIMDPNLVTKEQLLAMPFMDAALADAIIKGRPYADMQAVDRVVPLNAAQKIELYRKLFIPINLNTASRAEILLVPGVGARMAHEFEEYRPYPALAKFRREIGKYVDAAEVARLEQYVFLPIDLNTATDADILTIPGLGPRMLHEFKEYRPYTNIEQFRREIGKYVSKDEVARFERYVTIKK
jgi:DNA uptake protein ComE-like DNA-binding protein